MTQSTAQIVRNMLEVHYQKSKDGYYGGNPRTSALKLMEGGLLQDYLNENIPSGLVKEFDSALTWATPTNCRDRLLILNCAATADILPDDEPDHLGWRSVNTTPHETETVHLTKHPGTGFGFSLVTIDKSIYVRRVQPFSVAQQSGKLREGDRVLTVNGTTVGGSGGLTQHNIIKMLKSEVQIDLTVGHVTFDGKGCPETTYDRSSPLQSPALESSYKLALDLSSSAPSSTISNTSYEEREHLIHTGGLSMIGCDNMGLRGNIRADKHTSNRHNTHNADNLKYTSVGSVGDSLSTGSLEMAGCLMSGSSSGGDSVPDTRSSPHHTSILSSRSSHSSSINKDFYRDSFESLPNTSQTSTGTTEYVVLPNHGRGVGIGISGKSGVIIRNILPGSIADKDGRLQIGDHILQVNDIKCAKFGKEETKTIVIPTLRNSTPSVRLIVQHVCRKFTHSPSPSHTPTKTGDGATLPSHKQLDQGPDLLLPEAMWSDAHPTAPVAYRFGTVVIPAPHWIRWSKQTHFVTLTKFSNGFGFSIMDYKEPKQKSEDTNSVLIIRQITPFGAADMEGNLALGERILSINKEPITDHSIEDIVSIIKPCTILQLTMCKSIETDEWKSLLNTNISTVPLVSGPKTTALSSQESLSSTLNVQGRHPDPCKSSSSLDHSVNNTTSRYSGSDTGSLRRYQPSDRSSRNSGSAKSDENYPRYHGNMGSNHGNMGSNHGSMGSNHGNMGSIHGNHTIINVAEQTNSNSLNYSNRYTDNNPVRSYSKSNSLPRNQGNLESSYHGNRYSNESSRNFNSMTHDVSTRSKTVDYKTRSMDRTGFRNHHSHILSEIPPQDYETTFGIRDVKQPARQVPNCEVESIISAVSLNNRHLTELWKQRGADLENHTDNKHRKTEQLSRV